jgi:hypothetical protein
VTLCGLEGPPHQALAVGVAGSSSVEHHVTFSEPFLLLRLELLVLVSGLGIGSFGFTHLMVQVAFVPLPVASVLFAKGVLAPVVGLPRPPLLE